MFNRLWIYDQDTNFSSQLVHVPYIFPFLFSQALKSNQPVLGSYKLMTKEPSIPADSSKASADGII